MIEFKVTVMSRSLDEALNRLDKSLRDPNPALMAIGKQVYAQVRHQFETATDPWGKPWPKNAFSTLQRYLAGRKGVYGKRDGKLTKRGSDAVMAKKPLHGKGLYLSGLSLFSEMVERNSMLVASSAVYAAMQHFGGTKAEFPHLWGDIPARPFMPFNAAGNVAPETERIVTDVVDEYLDQAVG